MKVRLEDKEIDGKTTESTMSDYMVPIIHVRVLAETTYKGYISRSIYVHKCRAGCMLIASIIAQWHIHWRRMYTDTNSIY